MIGKVASAMFRAALALAIGWASVLPAQAAYTIDRPMPAQSDELDLLLAAFNEPNRQTVDKPDKPDNNGGDQNKYDHDRKEIRLTDFYTRKLVKDLNSIRLECTDYDHVYRIDCLRQGIDMMVASMPDDGEYARAKTILRRASSRLAKVVNTYADKSAPKLVAPRGANPRFKKRRSYTAVKVASLPTATAQAEAIVQEAATELLRSSENSERRYAHYQQISVAVDSTKVLLRSG